MLRVLIVDDDALIRDSLQLLLDLEDDFQVVATAANGQEAFSKFQEHQPDLVLMDVRMPVMDGVLGTKLIREHSRNVKIVILTTFKDDEYIKAALKNGASGYILKSQPAESIMETLRMVAKGNIVLEQNVATSLAGMIGDLPKNSREDLQLSARELEILELVSEGLSNREIAKKIYLSEGTVRNYITALLEKLSLRDRTQLAIFYLKNL